jgi:hypothetical protein
MYNKGKVTDGKNVRKVKGVEKKVKQMIVK